MGTIEINYDLAVGNRIGLQEAPAWIRIGLRGCIREYEEQALAWIAAQIRKMHFLTVDGEFHFATDGLVADISEDIGNVDRFLTIRRDPCRSDAIAEIDGEKIHALEVSGGSAVQVFHAQSNALAPYNDVHTQAAHLDAGWLAGNIRLQ